MSGEAQYGPLADQAARRYGVDPRLYRALITQESGWNPNAVSGAGARGLTQVVPKWHPKADLSTPLGQLDYGAKHLGSLLKKYGNPRDALAVYNSGRPWSTSQGFAETRNYVTKILGAYGGGAGAVPQSGGGAATDPGRGSLPALSGSSFDVKRVLGILKATEAKVLRGESPGDNYVKEMQKLMAGAVPRALATQGTRAAGAQIKGAAASVGVAGLTTPGGAWGGSEAPALAIAKFSGLPISSQKRDRMLTASGNPSDHWTGSKQSYAVDLATSGSQGDAAFRKIVTALGQPNLAPGTWHNLTIGGYRYQIGWRTKGHFDHIHVGVKKV